MTKNKAALLLSLLNDFSILLPTARAGALLSVRKEFRGLPTREGYENTKRAK